MYESLDALYLDNSKNKLFNSKNKKGHQFHYDESVLHLTKHAFTTFYNAKQIDLPEPNKNRIKNNSFIDVLVNRRSQREYSSKSISLEDLSDLLYYSAGTTSNTNQRRRHVPTGGNLNSTDIYFFATNISELEKGFYHYDFTTHRLNIIKLLDIENIRHEILYQSELAFAPLLIVLVANLARIKAKYGLRALRIVQIDCGAVMQNLYLVAEALGMCSCAIGGVIEYRIEEILDIDGIDQFVLLAQSIGKKL